MAQPLPKGRQMTTVEARKNLDKAISEMVASALVSESVEAGELVDRRLAIPVAIDAFAESVRAECKVETLSLALHTVESRTVGESLMWLEKQIDEACK